MSEEVSDIKDVQMFTQTSSTTYSSKIDKVVCSNQERKKIDWGSFKVPLNHPTDDSMISFIYNKGRPIVKGSETQYIASWKQLVKLGAQKQCDILNQYADSKKHIAYEKITFNTEDRLRIIKIPSSICILEYKDHECMNLLSLSSFYNSTCDYKNFDLKVAAKAIQDIYIVEEETKSYPKELCKKKLEEHVISWLLPTKEFYVGVNIDGCASNQIQFNISQDPGQKIDTVSYNGELQKGMLQGKGRAKLQMMADYHTYRIQIGFTVYLVGEIGLVRNKKNCQADYLINISKILPFQLNISQEISIDTPGNVTVKYFTGTCDKETENNEQIIQVKKRVQEKHS